MLGETVKEQQFNGRGWEGVNVVSRGTFSETCKLSIIVIITIVNITNDFQYFMDDKNCKFKTSTFELN